MAIETASKAKVVRGEGVAVQPLYAPSRLLKWNVLETEAELQAACAELAAAREEATRVTHEALAASEAVRQQAYEDGANRAAADFVDVVAQARSAIEALRGAIAADVQKLSFAFAKVVLDVEFLLRPETIVDLVRSVLDQARSYCEVTIVLHPDDVDRVRRYGTTLIDLLPHAEDIRICADPCLAPHGVRIETEMGSFDGSLEVQLARLREHLRGQQGEADEIQPSTEDGENA